MQQYASESIRKKKQQTAAALHNKKKQEKLGAAGSSQEQPGAVPQQRFVSNPRLLSVLSCSGDGKQLPAD